MCPPCVESDVTCAAPDEERQDHSPSALLRAADTYSGFRIHFERKFPDRETSCVNKRHSSSRFWCEGRGLSLRDDVPAYSGKFTLDLSTAAV